MAARPTKPEKEFITCADCHRRVVPTDKIIAKHKLIEIATVQNGYALRALRIHDDRTPQYVAQDFDALIAWLRDNLARPEN